ncbi:MAG: aminoacyl-tRNA hydrolase [Patescibacteria group bacterium]
MKLIIGLGNPDKEYQFTRHNFGWLAVDKLASKLNLVWDKSPDKKSLVTDFSHGREKILIGKTLTYMNNSGEAALSLAQYYKIDVGNLIVIHDDLDLPFGAIRLAQNRSSGGHQGLESIIKYFKSQDFIRVRLGIGPQIGKAEDFVLAKFSEEEKKKLPEVIDTSHLILEILLTQGFADAANKYNQKIPLL